MKVLVCLPTKNEKESIQIMIDEIRKLGLDLIVCDEHSNDGTVEIAKKNSMPVYQRDGLGRGYGIKKALEVASREHYDFLIFIDCDCSYPPKFIPDLLKHIPEYDMVIGIRDMQRIQLSHRIVNVFHTGLINLLFRSRFKDINSSLRAIRVEKLLGKLDATNFDIEAQMTINALKGKLRVKEVPIEYRKRRGKSKIRAYHTFVILSTIVKERFVR